MRDTEQTLARLAMGFTVQDIMVPKESLVYGRDEDSARKLLEEHRNLDVISIEQGGELVAYLQRGGKKQKGIRIKDVIGAGTSILDLVEVLESSCSEDGASALCWSETALQDMYTTRILTMIL